MKFTNVQGEILRPLVKEAVDKGERLEYISHICERAADDLTAELSNGSK